MVVKVRQFRRLSYVEIAIVFPNKTIALALYFLSYIFVPIMRALTTEEAAERLGVTATRIRAMILAGRLPAERFGRAHVIQESDLKLVQDRAPGRPRKDGARKAL